MPHPVVRNYRVAETRNVEDAARKWGGTLGTQGTEWCDYPYAPQLSIALNKTSFTTFMSALIHSFFIIFSLAALHCCVRLPHVGALRGVTCRQISDVHGKTRGPGNALSSFVQNTHKGFTHRGARNRDGKVFINNHRVHATVSQVVVVGGGRGCFMPEKFAGLSGS